MIIESNHIFQFFHCRQCLEDLPPDASPREHARLEVGWTEKGVQVWCVRCNKNVVHLDFGGLTVKVAEPVARVEVGSE